MSRFVFVHAASVARLIVAVLLCGATAGHAAMIIDTGPGSDGSAWTLAAGSQSLAAEFSLGAATTVTGVQGWIREESQPGMATAVIYTDGGDIPGTQLFAGAFDASGTTAAWKGPTALTWLLTPGTYWVAFEVRGFQQFVGSMPSPSPNPLGNEARNTGGGFNPYSGDDGLNIGVRIFGAPVAAVPEPSTYVLMLTGLGLVGFVANRRRKLQAVSPR